MANPITLKELLERGTDEDVQEIIANMFGETLSPNAKNIPLELMNAFGYGIPCECGERGLTPEEVKEGKCLECERAAADHMDFLIKAVDEAERGDTVDLTGLSKEKLHEALFNKEEDTDVGC